MKKIILTTIAALFICLTSGVSQTSLILGVGGGAHLSKVKTTGDFVISGEDFSRALRFGGGVDIGMRYGKWSLLTGVKYNQRGGKTTVNLDDPNGLVWVFDDLYLGIRERDIAYNVLSVPIHLRYAFGGDQFKVTLSAGPNINMINGRATSTDNFNLTGEGSRGPIETELEVGSLGDQLLKKTHTSFTFSPGILYKINEEGRIRLNINFESSGNILNPSFLVSDFEGNVAKASGSMKANVISFEVGYEHRIDFNLGSKY